MNFEPKILICNILFIVSIDKLSIFIGNYHFLLISILHLWFITTFRFFYKSVSFKKSYMLKRT